MADALVLGASTIWCVGSSPIFRTNGKGDLKDCAAQSGRPVDVRDRARPRAPGARESSPIFRTNGKGDLKDCAAQSGRPVDVRDRARPRAPGARESSPIFRTSGKQIPRPKSSCNCGSNRLHLFCAANLLSVSPYPKRCRCSVFSYQKEEVPP